MHPRKASIILIGVGPSIWIENENYTASLQFYTLILRVHRFLAAHSHLRQSLLLQFEQNCPSYISLSQTLLFPTLLGQIFGSFFLPWNNSHVYCDAPVLEQDTQYIPLLHYHNLNISIQNSTTSTFSSSWHRDTKLRIGSLGTCLVVKFQFPLLLPFITPSTFFRSPTVSSSPRTRSWPYFSIEPWFMELENHLLKSFSFTNRSFYFPLASTISTNSITSDACGSYMLQHACLMCILSLSEDNLSGSLGFTTFTDPPPHGQVNKTSTHTIQSHISYQTSLSVPLPTALYTHSTRSNGNVYASNPLYSLLTTVSRPSM